MTILRLQDTPILRGEEFIPHCLFAPCIILRPPDYLHGMCSPHPANNEKRHRLYIKFWRTLKDLNLWNDQEYTCAQGGKNGFPTC